MNRPRFAALLLAICCLLTGCTGDTPLRSSSALPTAAPGPEAPIGDAGLMREMLVPLHLPSLDGQELLTFFETLSIPRDSHPAERIMNALLAHEGNSRVRPLGGHVALSLHGANPVEVSGGVCTVDLSAGALQLSDQALHTVALAITATLCELPDIQYVNLLIAGAPVAMDVGGNLPLGSLANPTGQSLPILWETLAARRTPVGELASRTPLTAAATLYFPVEKGVVAEPRRLSFTGQHPQQLTTALLAALSAGAELTDNALPLPDLNALLLFPPEITDLDSGGRRATLHFTAEVKERIAAAGGDPVAVFAAITLTLTTFVPSLEQVCILTGDGALTSLYSPELGSMLFPGGLMTRKAFAPLLMGQARVYVPRENGMAAQAIALPYRSVQSPRALLLAMADPAVGALPAGLTDADVLGISVENGTLLVNLSAKYAQIIRQSGADQRLTAYAMVNTLCETLQVRRVRFYFGNAETESLGADLIWQGDFLYHPALIQ